MARRGRPPKNLADKLSDEARSEEVRESRLLKQMIVPTTATILIYGENDTSIRRVEIKESDGNVTHFGAE